MAVTEAPGTRPPLESSTVPLITAVDCAKATHRNTNVRMLRRVTVCLSLPIRQNCARRRLQTFLSASIGSIARALVRLYIGRRPKVCGAYEDRILSRAVQNHADRLAAGGHGN